MDKITILIPIANFLFFNLFISKIVTLSVIDSIGYAVTLTLIEVFLFKKVIWKFKYIQRLTGIKNIQGVWQGSLISNYDNKEHIIEKVIIRQSYKKYKVILETKESKSVSEINEIKINELDRMELQYIYKNEAPANLRQKNPMHFGVAALEYKDEKLVGSYWTDREIDDGKNTRGIMELTRVNQKGNYDLISFWEIFNLF